MSAFRQKNKNKWAGLGSKKKERKWGTEREKRLNRFVGFDVRVLKKNGPVTIWKMRDKVYSVIMPSNRSLMPVEKLEELLDALFLPIPDEEESVVEDPSSSS